MKDRKLEDFKTEVLENLSRERKTLPCKFFYDKTGSALFDRICELDEYYPTRTEISLLERHGGEFAELSGRACHVIEFRQRIEREGQAAASTSWTSPRPTRRSTFRESI